MKQVDYLEREWKNLTNKYEGAGKAADKIFVEVIANYSKKSRHYHNLTHIETLLHCLNDFSSNIKDYDEVAFAIWFHDIVYAASSKQNEEKSAEWAKMRMNELAVPQEKIDRTTFLILATAHHAKFKDMEDTDALYFLDFDLRILGAERDEYVIYMNQIRKEYKLIPDFLYSSGRKKALKSFIAQDNIYKTSDFKDKYEMKARTNIEYEINTL